MEKRVQFPAEDIVLEGLLWEGTGDKGVVITHPHPLYGGDMYNSVVEVIASAYRDKGCATLRFNFRGVGNSQGRHDQGLGEQKDVLAARMFLIEQGINRIALAGYSFGAWVNARVGCSNIEQQEMVMVSPPVAFIDFGPISNLTCLKLVITGSRDDIAPADQIKTLLPRWNPDTRFERIEGADHFYGAHLDILKSTLAGFL